MNKIEINTQKNTSGVRIEVSGADFSKSAISGVENTYLNELKKHYTPTTSETLAISKLFGKLKPYLGSMKLLYLFVGDNNESQRINAVNVENFKLNYMTTVESVKKGMVLNKTMLVNTGYAMTNDELRNYTMIGMGVELKPQYTGVYLGQIYNDNNRDISIVHKLWDGSPGFRHMSTAGGTWQQLNWTRNYVNPKWVAGTANATPPEGEKAMRLYTNWKPIKEQNLANTDNPSKMLLHVGCSSHNGISPTQAGFNSGYLQSIVFASHMSENDVRAVANALYEFNRELRD